MTKSETFGTVLGITSASLYTMMGIGVLFMGYKPQTWFVGLTCILLAFNLVIELLNHRLERQLARLNKMMQGLQDAEIKLYKEMVRRYQIEIERLKKAKGAK